MHKVFGEKKDVNYIDRKGTYLIAIEENKIAVVRTPKGLFLLGGGSDSEESDKDTIVRECLEEVGCEAEIDRFVCSAETYTEHPTMGYFHPIQNYYLGKLNGQKQRAVETDHFLEWIPYEELKGKLFVEMQNWALDECWNEKSSI